jgi:hypothetical protein
MYVFHDPESGTPGAPLRPKSSAPRSGFVQQDHWSECGRSTSAGALGVLGRPHRSVLSLDSDLHAMKPRLPRLCLGKASTLIFWAVLCAGLSIGIWLVLRARPELVVRPRFTVLQASTVTINHSAQFITLTNGGLVDRCKRFASWQVSKYQGYRYPVVYREIDIGGLANLYRDTHALSPGVMVPLELVDQKALFPTNCPLTNTQTSLAVARRALEELLCYNGLVGVREGPLLKLVKKEWVQTASAPPRPTKMRGRQCARLKRVETGRAQSGRAAYLASLLDEAAAAGRGR